MRDSSSTAQGKAKVQSKAAPIQQHANQTPSCLQGAVMVTLLSVFAFCVGLLRFRFTKYWFAFVVTTFSMAMVALNTFHLPYPQYKAMFYWWLQIALGVGTAALVSTFVAPVTAGTAWRGFCLLLLGLPGEECQGVLMGTGVHLCGVKLGSFAVECSASAQVTVQLARAGMPGSPPTASV